MTKSTEEVTWQWLTLASQDSTGVYLYIPHLGAYIIYQEIMYKKTHPNPTSLSLK